MNKDQLIEKIENEIKVLEVVLQVIRYKVAPVDWARLLEKDMFKSGIEQGLAIIKLKDDWITNLSTIRMAIKNLIEHTKTQQQRAIELSAWGTVVEKANYIKGLEYVLTQLKTLEN